MKDDYTKSLEIFMELVCKKFKCLPDYTDPENESAHVFRLIDDLKKERDKAVNLVIKCRYNTNIMISHEDSFMHELKSFISTISKETEGK